MQGLFHPVEWIRLRRKLYVLLLSAGFAGLVGWVITDAQATLAAESIPTVSAPADVRPLTASKSMDGFATWSPDGQQISFMRDGKIWLMSAKGDGARALTTGSETWDAVPAWKPDGKEIAYARIAMMGDQAWLMTVDPTTGKSRSLAQETAPIGHIAWAPDGRTLYYTTPQRLMRLDIGRSRPVPVMTVPDDWEMQAGGLAIRPDGKAAVFGAGPRIGRGVQYDLWTLDLTKRGAARERLTSGGGIMPAYDPAGKFLAYRNPRQESGIYLMDLKQHSTRLLVADEGRALFFHPSFSPDGRQLVISKLLVGTTGGGPDGSRFTSHLYLHTLAGSGGD